MWSFFLKHCVEWVCEKLTLSGCNSSRRIYIRVRVRFAHYTNTTIRATESARPEALALFFYSYVAASLLNVTSTSDIYQGCSPKKEVGDAWNKTYTKVFKQFRPTYTYTHTRQKNCHSESLVLSSDTATRVWVSVTDRYQLCYTEIILHCVSVSMCLQCLDAVGWAAGRASGL